MTEVKLLPRTCDSCHKCCDGWLYGSAHGKDFYPGKPCHYLTSGKGCGIYDQRPEVPCKSYTCEWLTNLEIPNWVKPNMSDVIITKRKIETHDYWDVIECGKKMDSSVLNWLMLHAINNSTNMVYRVDGGMNFLGTTEFIEAYRQFMDPKQNVADVKL